MLNLLAGLDLTKKKVTILVGNLDENNPSSIKEDFGNFFREHDKRRGTSFINIFPELENLYKKRGKK